MDTEILNRYGISFQRQENGKLKISAYSHNLDIFFYRLSRLKNELEQFIETMNLALSGDYNSIEYDDREWTQELGLLLYTGIIHDDMTFEIFMEDHYEKTKEIFPLIDIYNISTSLLEFIISSSD